MHLDVTHGPQSIRPSISGEDSGGPVTGTERCSECGREVDANPQDPATATNLSDFRRWTHALRPMDFHRVYRENPVNQNIRRDETPHELYLSQVSDDNGSADVLDRHIYQTWLSQQF